MLTKLDKSALQQVSRKTPVAAAICALLATSAAQSQVLEEITVTATKRASTIQDVPFSVNAQSQSDIERSGATTLEELSRNVAGLAIQNLGPGQSQVAVRGVSAGQIIRDQPGVKEQVGVYMDESVVSLSLFTPDFDLYDLNRVETLRGPQGTLFGSGSIGGTIRYITNQPNPDAFEGSLEANLNTLDGGDTGGHLKGMVNLPISDTAAFRAVAYSQEYGGFIDARREQTGQFDEDVNSGNRSGLRASLRFEPSDQWVVTPRVIYQNIETDGFNRQEVYNLFANPYTTTRPPIQLGEREQHLLGDEEYSEETLLTDLVVEGSFDGFDATFVASYLDRNILVSRDASALTHSVSIDLGLDEAATAIPSNLRDKTFLEQTSLELRFASNNDGPWQWVVGGFWSEVDREYSQRLPTPGYGPFVNEVFGPGFTAAVANGFEDLDSSFNSDLPYDIEQFAIFGELTYDVSEALQLTFGGRYYDFDEERVITTGGLFANGDAGRVDNTSSDGFTPRILASYALSENTKINGQISQGFRLGGVNDPLNTPICSPEDLEIFGGFQDYDDETLINYEIGVKTQLESGITVNAALFYADIDDLQVTLDAGSCSSRVSFNVEDASSRGIEVEVGGSVTDSFDFSVATSLLESEFGSTVRDGNGNIIGGVEDGNRLASVPEFQFAATGTWNFPLNWGGSPSDGYFSASVQHVGDRITQPSDQIPGAGNFVSGLPFGGATGNEVTSIDLELDAYTILNLSAGMIRDNWEAVIYLQNATDENALLSFDRERAPGRARLAYRTNPPRSLGVTLRWRFE
ncbi:MAG: TonB-dependent receptor [Xanthomonadales bacterium]|nr:TonB-dependent receptor [Xanthomonadales bacterium]